MIDIDAFQTALKTWVKTITGMPAEWEFKTTATIQPKMPARFVLTGPMNFDEVGQDYLQWIDVGVEGEEVQPTVVGQRHFDVMIRAVSRSQAGNKTASWWLEKLRAALAYPTTQDTFEAAEFAILDMSVTHSFDAPFEERTESIASATWRITAAISDAGDVPVGTLTNVEMTSRIEGEMGTDVPVPPNAETILISVE